MTRKNFSVGGQSGSADAFYSCSQVAQRLGLSVKTVRRLIRRGELPVHQFGSSLRISSADLAAFERLNRIA